MFNVDESAVRQAAAPQRKAMKVRTTMWSIAVGLVLVAVLLLAGGSVADAQKTIVGSGARKGGAPETMVDPFSAAAEAQQYGGAGYATGGGENDATLSKVEAQLLGALELLQQVYRETAPMPLKFAEKRRNKFEFIRFGRR